MPQMVDPSLHEIAEMTRIMRESWGATVRESRLVVSDLDFLEQVAKSEFRGVALTLMEWSRRWNKPARGRDFHNLLWRTSLSLEWIQGTPEPGQAMMFEEACEVLRCDPVETRDHILKRAITPLALFWLRMFLAMEQVANELCLDPPGRDIQESCNSSKKRR